MPLGLYMIAICYLLYILGAYQPRNTKIHSSRSMAFSAGKRYQAILRYAENRSIPFSRRFARVTLTYVSRSSNE